jgi:hypothetical protein
MSTRDAGVGGDDADSDDGASPLLGTLNLKLLTAQPPRRSGDGDDDSDSDSGGVNVGVAGRRHRMATVPYLRSAAPLIAQDVAHQPTTEIVWPVDGGDDVRERVSYAGLPADPLSGFRLLVDNRDTVGSAAPRPLTQLGGGSEGRAGRPPRLTSGRRPLLTVSEEEMQARTAAAKTEGTMVFQRRAGRPKWRDVMRLDVGEIVSKKDLSPLQDVLDTLAFSRFDEREMEDVPPCACLLRVICMHACMCVCVRMIVAQCVCCADTRCPVLRAANVVRFVQLSQLCIESLMHDRERIASMFDALNRDAQETARRCLVAGASLVVHTAVGFDDVIIDFTLPMW